MENPYIPPVRQQKRPRRLNSRPIGKDLPRLARYSSPGSGSTFGTTWFLRVFGYSQYCSSNRGC